MFAWGERRHGALDQMIEAYMQTEDLQEISLQESDSDHNKDVFNVADVSFVHLYFGRLTITPSLSVWQSWKSHSNILKLFPAELRAV